MMHEHLLFLDPLPRRPSATCREPLSSPKAYLAYGATTIRTAGTFNGSDDLQVARRMIRDGKFVGPDIHVTAPFLEGDGSFACQMVPITDPARARQIVNFWADAGATSFKIYMNLSRAVAGRRDRRGAQARPARSPGICARSPFTRLPPPASTASSTA